MARCTRSGWPLHNKTPTTDVITAEGLRRRLAAGVDSGRITEEEAGKRYRSWEESQSDQDAGRTISRADYAAAADKMKAMVASGEITEEQMNARLNRMRLMIGRGQSDQSSARTISRADYAAAAEKMKAMVASGEITEEGMKDPPR